jgi:hypothetical protein
VPVPTSLAAGTYRVTASYGASANFAGSSGTGQLVVAAPSTGSGSSPGEGSGGGTSGTAGTNGGRSGIDVAGYYYSPQQLAARAAAGVALQKTLALQALHEDALTQIAVNELRNGLRKLQDGSSKGGAFRGTRSGDGGTGNGSSSNPATVNLVASQSKPTSPAMTALLVGLLLSALAAVAIVAMRRKARRARVLVASAVEVESGE